MTRVRDPFLRLLPRSSLTLPLAALALISAFSGCAKKKSSLDPALQQSLESGITTVSGAADDASSSSFAALHMPHFLQKHDSQVPAWARALSLVSTAKAQSSWCVRALAEVCAAGVQSLEFNGCSVKGTAHTITGVPTLTYSNSACSLTVGESVTSTFAYTISGPLGGQVSVTSETHENYLDQEVGGGARLTQTSPSKWQLDILGKHAVAKRGDEMILDASVRTAEPVTVSGSVLRGGRTMDGGKIEVNHNLRGFTATYEPAKLHWSKWMLPPRRRLDSSLVRGRDRRHGHGTRAELRASSMTPST